MRGIFSPLIAMTVVRFIVVGFDSLGLGWEK